MGSTILARIKKYTETLRCIQMVRNIFKSGVFLIKI